MVELRRLLLLAGEARQFGDLEQDVGPSDPVVPAEPLGREQVRQCPYAWQPVVEDRLGDRDVHLALGGRRPGLPEQLLGGGDPLVRAEARVERVKLQQRQAAEHRLRPDRVRVLRQQLPELARGLVRVGRLLVMLRDPSQVEARPQGKLVGAALRQRAKQVAGLRDLAGGDRLPGQESHAAAKPRLALDRGIGGLFPGGKGLQGGLGPIIGQGLPARRQLPAAAEAGSGERERDDQQPAKQTEARRAVHGFAGSGAASRRPNW